MRRVWVLAVLLIPSIAHADWYYEWTSGGYRGPFATYDACQADRYTGDNAMHSNLCMQSATPPSGGSHGVAPFNHLSIGAIGGLGYRAGDGATNQNNPGFTAGLDTSVWIGARPGFTVGLLSGVRYTHSVPAMGAATSGGFVPFELGLDVNLRLGPKTRLVIGAAGGLELGFNCDACKVLFDAEGHIGMNFYTGEAGYPGFGWQIVAPLGPSTSDRLLPPQILLRLSIVTRNESLAW